jgi:hypothetical protein
VRLCICESILLNSHRPLLLRFGFAAVVSFIRRLWPLPLLLPSTLDQIGIGIEDNEWIDLQNEPAPLNHLTNAYQMKSDLKSHVG